MKDYSIISFIKSHLLLIVAFVLAILVYIIFELASWISNAKNIRNVVEFNKLVEWFNHENAILLDVRTGDQYNAGSIVGSINILSSELTPQHKIFTNNSHRKIILIDQDGHQAAKSVAHLLRSGMPNQLWFLKGGVNAWKANNMPLVVQETDGDLKNIKSYNNNSDQPKTSKIIMYTKDACPYCLSAKNLLRSKQYGYQEIKVTGSNSAEFAEMVKLTGGVSTVPQVFINNKHIGGFDTLQALNDTGELDQILQQNI